MKYILLALLGVLLTAVGYWLIAPAFIDVEIQDELDPEIAALITQSNEVTNTNTTDQSTDIPTPIVRGPFTIASTPGHGATGSIRTIETEAETTIRFEDYQGTNGPDLFVYLANDLDATEFVSLGRTRGNQGNINYTVPEDIDINDYKYVMTWCKAFGVLFDYAEIN